MGSAAERRSHGGSGTGNIAGCEALRRRIAASRSDGAVANGGGLQPARGGVGRGGRETEIFVSRRRCSECGGDRAELEEEEAGREADQRLRTDGDDDIRGDGANPGSRGEREKHPDWAADCEHADLHTGRSWGTGTGRGSRGAIHWRSGGGAWVFEPTGVDGGKICQRSVFGRTRGADVPDGGCGALAGRWEHRVFGAE